jgi:hypothetical protein
MILLTERERQKLKEATRGMSAKQWEKIPPSEKRAQWSKLDQVIQSIMFTHPEAFTEKAVKDMRTKMSYNRY